LAKLIQLKTQTKLRIENRTLIRNSIWNFVGIIFPLSIGIFTIPILIDGLGEDRFGLLIIIWMGVGYFSLFDMGLGRALTKLIAEKQGAGDTEDLGSLIWSALWLILMLGLLAAFLVIMLSGIAVQHILTVPEKLIYEAKSAIVILGIGLPFVVITSALNGILEAEQRFRELTIVRIPLGLLSFLGPLATLQFSPSLVWATAVMLLGRVLVCMIFFNLAARSRAELTSLHKADKRYFKPLFNFGSWMTVSNLIGPLMLYGDRFLIGALLSVSAVTYYATPYEVLSKLQLVTAAIMGVMFPALTALVSSKSEKLLHTYSRMVKGLWSIMLPLSMFFFLFAPELLQLWLGDEFRSKSADVVRWLSLGWLINVLAQGPFIVLQSHGRPDLIAKSHLAELIPYALLLWMMVTHFGIIGAAFTWFVRVCVDTVILNLLALKQMQGCKGIVLWSCSRGLAILLGAIVLWNVSDVTYRIMVFLLISLTCLPVLYAVIRNFFNVSRKDAGLSQ